MLPKIIRPTFFILITTAFALLEGCVDEINFRIPTDNSFVIVEGMINDLPGPYTVRLSTGSMLDSGSSRPNPLQRAQVLLHDDEGAVESLSESEPGVYRSSGIIRGQIGRTYHISVHLEDGRVIESITEQIQEVGFIEEIRYEFEPKTITMPFGDVPANIFNVYVDGELGPVIPHYVRWRFQGTYLISTHPELYQTHNPPYTPYKDPRPCSGYIVVGGPVGSGGLLEQVDDCTCCTCWITQYEAAPQVSDGQFVANGKFRNVKVAEVPVNNFTFHDKYLIEVEQFSLSKNAFDFFSMVRSQKENASNLFQSPPGEIRGNVKFTTGSGQVVGLFYATSVTTKHVFIGRQDVPYPVTPIDFITEACTSYPNSSNQKPALWE